MSPWETGMVTPDSDAIGRIVTHVDMGHEELEEHLRELDYHWSNTYFELRADLESVPQMPELNAYLQVAPWDDMWEDPVRRAANRLADQEWGRPPSVNGAVADGAHRVRAAVVVCCP